MFNTLPDPRKKERCRYSPAELLWPMLLMFLSRAGSRNKADASRNTGGLPAALARLAGRGSDTIPEDGEWRVTCSDNGVLFLKRLRPELLEAMQVSLVRGLFERRVFDASRAIGGKILIVVIDGSIREKCRKGFREGGKTNGEGLYRYVLQASVLLFGHPIPLLQEHVDVVDPEAEKEDCEIKAAKRLLIRLKEAFPRMKFVILGDALYACRPVAAECVRHAWHFCFTFKQGRTPAVWEEAMKLMEITPQDSLRYRNKPDTDPQSRTGRIRWTKNIDFSEKEDGSLKVTAIEQTETFRGNETRYAWISDVPGINAANVLSLVSATGRMRHTIEDQFNTHKNNGIGMGHVFCADATTSKNLYTLMQIAFMLWTLFYHGLLKRVCAWAGRWPQIAIAQLLPQGLRMLGGANPGFTVGQLRFVT